MRKITDIPNKNIEIFGLERSKIPDAINNPNVGIIQIITNINQIWKNNTYQTIHFKNKFRKSRGIHAFNDFIIQRRKYFCKNI